MTHTSGIADHFKLGLYKSGLKNEDVLKILMKQEALDFEPGDRFSYSNGGYVLLALIVEKASSQPFHLFMRKHIFEPLNMTHTLVYNESEPFVPYRAIGYDASGKLADYNILTYGDGGLFSTVEDLLKWDKALYTQQLVSAATLQKAFTPFRLNNHTQSNYGYGWFIIERGFGKSVVHGGHFFGFVSFIERQLTRQNTIIMLTNRGSFAGEEIQDALRSILQDKPFELPRTGIAVETKILKDFVDEYFLNSQISIEVTLEAGALFVNFNKWPNVPKMPISILVDSESISFSRLMDFQVIFLRNEKGTVTGMDLYKGGLNHMVTKVR